MNKIIRLWNQNRRKIIIIALVIVFFFIVLQALNQIAKNNIEKNNAEQENKEKQNLPTQSIITGEVVKEETTKINVNIIESFTEACNNQNLEEAYNLLTNECKEILFPTEQDFINNYYNIIFNVKRTIDIDNIKNSTTTNTYLVTFYEDSMSTGKISNENKYQDYITVDKQTGKLNINSLITSKKINKEKEENGVKITVIRQEIYIDYEKFEIKAENKTSKTIALDTMSTNKSIYIMDGKNVKNTSSVYELPNNLLQLQGYVAKTFTIKFNKNYNPSSITKKIIFTDVILDYDKYKQESTQDDKIKIEVEI